MKENGIIKDSAIYLTGKIIPGVIMFLSIPLFIRLFGEDIYGDYSLIITTVLLLNTFLTGWINQSYMRFYTAVDDKEKLERQVYKILFLGNVLFIVIGDILLKFYGFDNIFIVIIDLIIISLSLFSFQIVAYRTKFKAVKVVIADSIRTIVFIVSILVLFYFLRSVFQYSILLLLFANLLAYVSGVILLKPNLFQLKSLVSILKEKIELNEELKKMISYGLPIAFWMVAAYLLNISDKYVIEYYIEDELGKYAAVYDIFSKFMTLAFAPILLALQPTVIKLFNEGKEKESFSILKKTIGIEIVAFIVFIAVLYFTKSFIVTDFIKLKDSNSVNLVLPIFIGAFLWTISMLIHKPIELSGKTYIMLIAVILALIVNFVGNVLFIPVYGVIVAAYTTIIGSVVYLFIILIALLFNGIKTK